MTQPLCPLCFSPLEKQTEISFGCPEGDHNIDKLHHFWYYYSLSHVPGFELSINKFTINNDDLKVFSPIIKIGYNNHHDFYYLNSYSDIGLPQMLSIPPFEVCQTLDVINRYLNLKAFS